MSMLTQDNNQPSAKTAPGPKPSARLHSIAGLQRGREFAGEFETGAGKYQFVFTPRAAKLVGGKLELTGDFGVTAARGQRRQVRDVKATLASTQGGLGVVPQRVLDRTPNLSLPIRTPDGPPPTTEATDELSWVGVLYLRLSPLDAHALGLTVDLSSVQLNARLLATSDLERDLQIEYGDLVAAAYGKSPDPRRAAAHVDALNRLFSQAM
jgi:hypothetical protein